MCLLKIKDKTFRQQVSGGRWWLSFLWYLRDCGGLELNPPDLWGAPEQPNQLHGHEKTHILQGIPHAEERNQLLNWTEELRVLGWEQGFTARHVTRGELWHIL